MEKKESEGRKSHASESEKLVREFIANMVHGVEAAIQSNTLDVKLLGVTHEWTLHWCPRQRRGDEAKVDIGQC